MNLSLQETTNIVNAMQAKNIKNPVNRFRYYYLVENNVEKDNVKIRAYVCNNECHIMT